MLNAAVHLLAKVHLESISICIGSPFYIPSGYGKYWVFPLQSAIIIWERKKTKQESVWYLLIHIQTWLPPRLQKSYNVCKSLGFKPSNKTLGLLMFKDYIHCWHFWWQICSSLFNESAPLSRFSHIVAMSVYLFVCLSVCLPVCYPVQFFSRPLFGPEITWSVPGPSLVLPPPKKNSVFCCPDALIGPRGLIT